jgi:transposase
MGSSIGVDSHKCSLAAAAVDELGRVIGVREFPNDPQGHLALLAWARDHETPRAIGVEGSGNYGAALCRALSSAGEQVLEVPATLTFRERRRKGSQGNQIRSTRSRSPASWPGARRCLHPDEPRRLPT